MNRSAEVLELGSRDGVGIIDKNGAHYLYRGERLGQGRDRAAAALDEKPELRERIIEEIVAHVKGIREPPAVAAAG